MDADQLARILEKNPGIDRTAIARSQQAAKQLAEVGIELGGYRLEPALGGGLGKPSGQALDGEARQVAGASRHANGR